MGTLALVAKGKQVVEDEDETNLSDCELTSEEFALMVSNPRRFEKKKFPSNKNRNWKGSYSSEKVKEEKGNNDEDEFGGVEVWSTNSEDEEIIRDEQFDTEWYIDSGCSCHVTGRKEELREYRELENGGLVKFGNNALGEIKGYDMITNGKFSIHKVAYVEGLQHNLISVSQLVVGTRLKVSFDDEGSKFFEMKTKSVLLKSKRKGKMYPLDINTRETFYMSGH
ncbi:uncharacterized protein LOC128126754 [Lactuca sativa]|uniref:uncharacterized protein LOC128126754 n=1 Tax=Lactuca sativa TaxID=4236 RepID=UPI0022AEC9B7|nr:uncharacterized protein LOC128126754 [Lactuca sativa]